jgi:deazaflavin-dependent oxidoreductase (nitroreductase family)
LFPILYPTDEAEAEDEDEAKGDGPSRLTTLRNTSKKNHMPNDTLKERLSRYRQIEITVTGRKSGRAISVPVWFVLEKEELYLLPVHGSDTQWYKNVLNNPTMQTDARGARAEVKAVVVNKPAHVASVVEKFREKYGARDVDRYYSKFDVAVIAQMV